MNSVSNDSDLYTSLGLAGAQPQPPENDGLKLEDFMKLMVTELTHQDPFKPMENTELATQISQFATVAGIDDLNSSFNSLSSTITSDQALQATNLVGHDVLVAGNLGWLSNGGNVQGSVDLPSSASNVRVRITDASGALVRELELGTHEAGEIAFIWDGYNDSGDYMPVGLYQISAQAMVDDVEMAPNVLVSAQVESVSLGGSGGVSLNLAGLGQVSMQDIAQIQ
ncbi:MAG: flagellar hook assembly protein FlgD [Pseudomonadota bacterium]